MTDKSIEEMVSIAAASLASLQKLREELQSLGSDPTHLNPENDVLARAKNNLEFINRRIASAVNDFTEYSELMIDLGPQSKGEGDIGRNCALSFNSKCSDKKVEWSSATSDKSVALSKVHLDNYYLLDPNYRPTVVYLGNLTKDKIIQRFESYLKHFVKLQKSP